MGMSAAFVLSALVQFLLGLVVAWLLGPAEFGAYALAVAAGILLQTLGFEWLRLAATRFFHAGAAGLRRRLVLALLASAAGAGLVFGLALPFLPGSRPVLLALVPGLALAAGFLDLIAAMLRARFREADYARVLLVRNALAITLVPLAAGLTGRAEAAGLALLASLVAAALAAWRLESAQAGQPAEPAAVPLPSLLALAGYSGPVVATNLLYLALFFALRSWAAMTGGLALAGQVSLALDFVLKLFTTFGSALDLWLFQRAVQAARDDGPEAGQGQLNRNQELVLSLLLAMALGLVLVIEALEGLLVRPDFRGLFAEAVMLLTPGIFLYALIQYAVHPYAQLAQRTIVLPLTALSVVACAGLGAGVLAWLPPGLAGIGIALTGSMAAGLLLLAARSPGYQAPSSRFLGKLTVAILAMVLPVALMRQWDSGVLAALAAIALGAVGFGLAAWLVDLAGVRQIRLSRRSVS